MNLIPENFRELLASVLFLIGVIFSFLSLDNKKKEHTLRLAGLFVLSAIALFSNDGWCYFAAVFIVATAVTQLEFLQNLAAIIRGNKDYFDYQKEFISQKEVEESKVKEIEEIEKEESVANQSPSEDIKKSVGTFQTNQTKLQQVLICEEYTFRFLERKYNNSIQRHIRLIRRGMHAELDGVMQMDKHDIIFELKIFPRGEFPTLLLQRDTEKMINMVKAYIDVTTRHASLSMVLVGPFTEKAKERIYNCKKKVEESEKETNISFEILSFDDIGLPKV